MRTLKRTLGFQVLRKIVTYLSLQIYISVYSITTTLEATATTTTTTSVIANDGFKFSFAPKTYNGRHYWTAETEIFSNQQQGQWYLRIYGIDVVLRIDVSCLLFLFAIRRFIDQTSN